MSKDLKNLSKFSLKKKNSKIQVYIKHTGKLGNEVLNYLRLGLQSLLSLKNLSLKIGKPKVFQKEAKLYLLKKLVTVLKG